jgi:hypothetical protein
MEKATVARDAAETRPSILVASFLLFLWGAVVIGGVFVFAFSDVDFSRDYPLDLVFAARLGYGALCVATAVWLSRLDRYSVPGVVTLAVLSFGKALADVSRHELDGVTLGLHVALPLLALYAVMRYRRLFRGA